MNPLVTSFTLLLLTLFINDATLSSSNSDPSQPNLCPICNEHNQQITINCGHKFCRFCIHEVVMHGCPVCAIIFLNNTSSNVETPSTSYRAPNTTFGCEQFDENPNNKESFHPVLSECGVCFQDKYQFRFGNCSHVLCNDCIKKLKSINCPFCRNKDPYQEVPSSNQEASNSSNIYLCPLCRKKNVDKYMVCGHMFCTQCIGRITSDGCPFCTSRSFVYDDENIYRRRNIEIILEQLYENQYTITTDVAKITKYLKKDDYIIHNDEQHQSYLDAFEQYMGSHYTDTVDKIAGNLSNDAPLETEYRHVAYWQRVIHSIVYFSMRQQSRCHKRQRK